MTYESLGSVQMEKHREWIAGEDRLGRRGPHLDRNGTTNTRDATVPLVEPIVQSYSIVL